MATTVKITETYDLKTTVNKLGIIGIHTPSSTQIKNLYGGLVKSHRFLRFLKCDVVGACASVLPADPLQVGVSAGNIAPEDMFNPILLKAVTNESFDTLVSRIYRAPSVGALGSVKKDELTASTADQFKAYYALLAENRRFRKAMPQSGFAMRNLVPICHTLVSTFGNTAPIGNTDVLSDDGETPVSVPDTTTTGSVNADLTIARGSNAVTFRGKSVRMPKIPLHVQPESGTQMLDFNVPDIYVGAIIVPPAKLNEFYYRMRVTWTMRFENVISSLEMANLGGYAYTGGLGYASSYTFAKSESKMDNDESAVSTDNVEMTKVMEA